MLKKIGTLTFHRALNFGAMLQAYALQSVLQERYEVEIIDYRNEKIELVSGHKMGFKNRLILVLRFFLRHNLVKKETKKKQNFFSFYDNYLKVSRRKYSNKNFKTINDDYQLCIVGSDQVWNPFHTGNDYNYFLHNINPEIIGTYAVSFGNNSVIDRNPNKGILNDYLKRFNQILVREEEALDYVNSVGVNCELVCDPIFLLSKHDWIKRISIRERNDEYILLFIVAPQTHSIEFARALADKYGLKVKYISTYGSLNSVPEWCDDCMTAGPIDFLELLYNAEYIVTTSFHGMAFSINFNKQFYYELDKRENANNSRLLQLAKEYNLSQREIKSAEPPLVERIEYERINGILDRNRCKSKELLFKQVEDGD